MKVLNIRESGLGPGKVYIGRPGRGQEGYFGNPVVINRRCPVCGGVHTTGGSTLACYEQYLRGRLASDPQFKAEFVALRGKDLVCFCHPNPCHGNVMVRVLAEIDQPPAPPPVVGEVTPQ